MTLVLHFNAFTGRLEGGYLMHRASKARAGDYLRPEAALAYMAANPEARCDPLKV